MTPPKNGKWRQLWTGLGIVNAATGRARELPVIGRFRLLR